MKSVIGYKIGMTQVFTEEGICIPVTVVEVAPQPPMEPMVNKSSGSTSPSIIPRMLFS